MWKTHRGKVVALFDGARIWDGAGEASDRKKGCVQQEVDEESQLLLLWGCCGTPIEEKKRVAGDIRRGAASIRVVRHCPAATMGLVPLLATAVWKTDVLPLPTPNGNPSHSSGGHVHLPNARLSNQRV